ncbi:MAG: hypothetical protein CVU84_15175 [Firmicutes bacterium HGW-Firmicutes-1]|jgi:diadenosine tetraphosphate (Ap4A) HIT family hydrolase|nr:MAG: hypothetical protein CVU84_15175 [Firmicutes bacterium HGW-Firmicutes-1]
MDDCSICAEINMFESETNYFDKYLRNEIPYRNNRIIFESNNFLVLPTLGAFVKGYLLIISKRHYQSGIKLSTDLLVELNYVIEQIKSVIKDIYGKSTIMFEHGTISSEGRSACCVEHFHLHLVPSNINIANTIKSYNFETLFVDEYIPLDIEFYGGMQSYIYYEYMDIKEIYLNDIFPSQLIRQVCCRDIINSHKWDWRKYKYINNIIGTIQDMQFAKENNIVNIGNGYNFKWY